jgi:hypothetical protein
MSLMNALTVEKESGRLGEVQVRLYQEAARHQLDRGQIFSVEGSAHERLPRRKKQACKVANPKLTMR